MILKIISIDAWNVYVLFFNTIETVALCIGTSQVHFQCVAVMWSFFCLKTTHKNIYIVHNRIFETCMFFVVALIYYTNEQLCLCRPCPWMVISFRVGTPKSLCTDSPNRKSPENSMSCSACHRTFEDCGTNFLFPSLNIILESWHCIAWHYSISVRFSSRVSSLKLFWNRTLLRRKCWYKKVSGIWAVLVLNRYLHSHSREGLECFHSSLKQQLFC